MKFTIKNISVIILASVFFAFGSGVTVCKMVCFSSGDIQFALNEEGTCCDDTEDEACCDDETSHSDELECCSHTDNSLVLDQYVPGDKVFVSAFNYPVTSQLIFNSIVIKTISEASFISYSAPPPLSVEDFSSFAHLLRI